MVRPSNGKVAAGDSNKIKESVLQSVDALRIDQGKKGGGV